MSDNAIDLIVAEKAFTQLQDLINKLGEVDSKITDTVKKANDQFKNIGTINTPSLSGDNSAEMAKLNKELKESIDLANKYKTQVIALSEAKEKYNRTVSQESVNETIKRKNAREDFKATSDLIGAYERKDLALKKAMKSAQDTGALHGSLSKQFLQESVNVKKLSDELKAIDATLGKNNRNVGNYKSGFNGLSNSINQLTREAPAFANSIGTGFMALSNNIPILADEIANLRQKNLDLVASGQPTQSMFKTIVGAIFSWQTLLSVGVTLLTIYGAKLVDFTMKALSSKDAVKSLAENQKELNDTLAENSKSYAEQKVKIDVLYKTATDLNNSYKDRKDAVDDLQQLYPSYFKNIDDEIIMAGKAKNQYDLLSKAILTTAQARASEEILQKRESERLIIEQDTITEITKKYKELANTKNEKTISASVGVGGVSTIIGKEAIRRDIQNLRNESVAQREKWAKEDAFFVKKVAEGNAISDTLLEESTKKATKAKKDNSKVIREEAVQIEVLIKKKSFLIEELDKEIEFLQKEAILNGSKPEEYAKIIVELEKLRAVRKSLNELPVGGALPDSVDMPKQIKQVEQLTDANLKYLQSFVDEFASNSGFSETFKMLQGDIEGFGENWKTTTVAVMESVQEMFNFISNASQQNFEAEYARLESQKEIAIGFAGDSAVAKENIEKIAEKKKKEIANRENKAKQKQAMYNIAIDTAQAIVSALPNIPLSIAIGALGAIELAVVASQKIPQYFDGTDNHTGGLMLVNDGKGANYKEKIVLPNGQVILPQDRNVLMEAPKGTKVLNHEQQLFEMLQGKGVSMSVAQSQGMTADEMDMILAKHFSGIKTHNTTIDKNGFNSYIRNGNSITRMNSNRSQGIGLSV